MKRTIAISMILLMAIGCSSKGTGPAVPAPAADAAQSAAVTAGPQAVQLAEYAFTFSAQTLDGDTVTEAVFGQHELTMVNVWASWCPPCRGELGELGALYGRLPENVGFLSVTVDDAGDLEDAKALLKENNCAFPCLDGQGSAGLMSGFLKRVQAIPTTLFFDHSGNQVGGWIVGVPQGKGSVADAYLSEIQARLDLLKVK